MARVMAGSLDLEVTIEELRSEGTPGYPTETWRALDTGVFMSREDLRGNERVKTEQLAAMADVLWTTHWREDMDPDDVDVPKKRRLVFKGRIFNIVHAVEMGRQEGLQLFTRVHSAL